MKNTTEITTTEKDLQAALKKNSLGRTIVYTLIVCVLAGLLVFCYFSVFSSNFYLRSFKGEYLVGVVDTSTYINTNNGDVLCVAKYAQIEDVQIEDTVFYAGNSGKGSGKVVSTHIAAGYITIDSGGQSKNIALSSVVGKVTANVAFWGYILWFFQSVAGVVVLNVLLCIVVVWHIILAATVETSKKGRELQRRLAKENRQQALHKKMLKNYNATGLDAETFEALAGSYDQNKQFIAGIAKRKDLSNAYKFLLQKVHEVYLVKQKLTQLDKTKITNCIELMATSKEFDADQEYMLTDLILRTNLVNFDNESFAAECKEFVLNSKSDESLLLFLTVLYVLVKNHKETRTQQIYEICDALDMKLTLKNAQQNPQELSNLSNYIKNIIKN
ncbi:MAG: hypothetical protein IJ542_00750 [Clostridia bacterium]|nr:hypothetical protein [Clostridia bacterium]